MQLGKRPFYIIGHNPNSIADVEKFLSRGANAIGPDIIYRNNRFYVTHNGHLSYKGVPFLEDYLQQLTQLLLLKKYPLALIVFDIKDTNFDINMFIATVKKNFSHEVCKGITLLITHPSDTSFLLRYQGNYEDVGIGIDDTNVPVEQVEKQFIAAGHSNFSYADGIIALLNKPRVLSHIHQATVCRANKGSNSYKLIFTWVLERRSSMRQFLNHYIDGIMVDVSGVKKLRSLLNEPCYQQVYQLATKEHNPFKATPISNFLFTVTTGNKLFAGTNARVQFLLQDIHGKTLQSLPFDAGVREGFESGATTMLSIDDIGLSSLYSLKISLLSGAPFASWLPEKIVIQSPCRSHSYVFMYDDTDWVNANKSPITKQPTNKLASVSVA